MTLASILLGLVCSVAILGLERRWAPLFLLVGASYMTFGQFIDVGPFRFHVVRILIAVGILRILLRGERIQSPWTGADKVMIVFAAWCVLSSFFYLNLAMLVSLYAAFAHGRQTAEDPESDLVTWNDRPIGTARRGGVV